MLFEEKTWLDVKLSEVQYVRIKTMEEFLEDNIPIERTDSNIFWINISPGFIGEMDNFAGLICRVEDFEKNAYFSKDVRDLYENLQGTTRFRLQIDNKLNPSIKNNNMFSYIKQYDFREYMLIPLSVVDLNIKTILKKYRNFHNTFEKELI
jgi:hypothetical protein